MRTLAALVFVYLLAGCSNSPESRIDDVSRDFFQALSERDERATLELVYPPVLGVLGRERVVEDLFNRWNPRYKIKEVKEHIGPLASADGRVFYLATYLVKRGRPIGRKVVYGFVFVSENKEDWYIVPYNVNGYEDFPADLVTDAVIPPDVMQQIVDEHSVAGQ
jgi:hypothetical protein